MFDMSWQEALLALALSCFVAVLAVRALGQTDLNPVSGVGKISQLAFAFLFPGHVVANVVSGALAEAGAMQSGDLLQAFMTGHLLRASPRALFFAQLLGASLSVFVTVFAYQLYDNVYGVPSESFPAPSAEIWLKMAKLTQSGGDALPSTAFVWAAAFGVIGLILALLEGLGSPRVRRYVPSGIALGIGMYLTPDWTLLRFIGGLVDLIWRSRSPMSHRKHSLMIATGFVFGDGVMSIVALVLKSFHVPAVR
eukprot:TRINITY_DN33843_c0_g3_i1.p1 TRINITY_DN33843_c0_g3~~TRINITY_DN33843_c0_g3_i1.p1  ORF type:complete len:270 (-),score=44.61 TRINITY_DN33843_c0_g3_i1:94-849(-)